MANPDSTRPPPGAEILQDLTAAIAGARCLIGQNAPADDIAFARNLLCQAQERAHTLREVISHGN